MAYVELDFVKNVLRDDYLKYPADLDAYMNFAETEINSRLVAQFHIPFDDVAVYPTVPPLIKWIAAYLVGWKLYDERVSTINMENAPHDKWWSLAQSWLTGLMDGTYILHLDDGSVVGDSDSTTGPRAYPTGLREKAVSSDNVPYFTRSQAGEW